MTFSNCTLWLFQTYTKAKTVLKCVKVKNCAFEFQCMELLVLNDSIMNCWRDAPETLPAWLQYLHQWKLNYEHVIWDLVSHPISYHISYQQKTLPAWLQYLHHFENWIMNICHMGVIYKLMLPPDGLVFHQALQDNKLSPQHIFANEIHFLDLSFFKISTS